MFSLIDLNKKPSYGHTYVYLLCCGDSFKIGITTGTLKKRIQELQTGNCEEIWCKNIYECPSEYAKDLEKMLHFRNSITNIKNEWFSLNMKTIQNFTSECNKCLNILKHLNTKKAGS